MSGNSRILGVVTSEDGRFEGPSVLLVLRMSIDPN